MLLLLRSRRNLHGKESLQSSGMDSGVAKLPRCAGGWRKTLDLEPLRFRGAADNRKRRCLTGSSEPLDTLNSVWRTQDILNNAPLGAVHMLVTIGNGDCLR